MNRHEDFAVGAIDRRRERAESRDQRTARRSALQARAGALLACEIANLPANDHLDFSEALAASVRVQLVRLHGEPSAASILSREAYEAGKNILPRKVALARAEQLLTRAANDEGQR